MPAKLTNELIDKRLILRHIKRLDNYINSGTPISWECLVEDCGRIWKTTSGSILNSKTGCPRCAENEPLSNSTIDQRLIGRNIKRLNDYNGAGNKINWQCTVKDCNYIWKTTPSMILNSKKSGCPDCAGLAPLSNDLIDQKLIDRNIKRLDNYQNVSTKIKWQCLIEDCNHIWSAKPNDVLNSNKSGCPDCSAGKNEKLIGKILLLNNIGVLKRYDIRKIINSENRRIHADFYISNKNIIIEYNGVQHYRPERFGNISIEQAQEKFIKQQARDLYLQQFCDTNNIKLIWIDGRTYVNDKLKNHLIDTIIPQLQLK